MEIIYLSDGSVSDKECEEDDDDIFADPIQTRLERMTDMLNASMPLTRPDKLSEKILSYLKAPDRGTMLAVIKSLLDAIPHVPGMPLVPLHIQREALVNFLLDSNNFTKASASKKVVAEIRSRNSMVVYPPSFVRLLEPKSWIDEVVVNAIGLLLENHFTNKMGFLPTYLWASNNPETYFSRCFAQDFRDLDYIFAPLSADAHWMLLVIRPQLGIFHFYNSYPKKWSAVLKSNPQLATTFKLLKAKIHHIYPDVEWSKYVTNIHKTNQLDGTSCGLYVMHTMHCLLANRFDLASQLNTWDDHQILLRFHFACALITSQFLRPIRGSYELELSEEII